MMDNIEEIRFRVYERDGYKCRWCGLTGINNLQMAHGIAKTEADAKMVKRRCREMFKKEITMKQAFKIINSKYNLFTSCEKCNSHFNFGNKPKLVDEFLIRYNDKMGGLKELKWD